jgi:hypothetical protein
VTKSGHATRVKRYKYFEQLSFLNNYFRERETKGEIQTQAEVDDEPKDLMETENQNSQSQITDNP